MIELKICLCFTCPAMIASLTPSALNVLMSFPSCPSDIQCTVLACFSISGNVSSLIAATTISIPWLRAASSTRNGNFPFPAIKPYLLDDSTIRRFDEIENDLNLRRVQLCLNCFHCLGGVELGLKEQSKSCLDIADLFGGETLSLETKNIGPISACSTLTDCF